LVLFPQLELEVLEVCGLVLVLGCEGRELGLKVVGLREEVCYLTVLVVDQLSSVLSFLHRCLKVVDLGLELCVFVEEVRDLLVFVIHRLISFLDLFLLRGNILLGFLLDDIKIRTKEGRLQVK